MSEKAAGHRACGTQKAVTLLAFLTKLPSWTLLSDGGACGGGAERYARPRWPRLPPSTRPARRRGGLPTGGPSGRMGGLLDRTDAATSLASVVGYSPVYFTSPYSNRSKSFRRDSNCRTSVTIKPSRARHRGQRAASQRRTSYDTSYDTSLTDVRYYLSREKTQK